MSCCPANDASGKSSAVADDLIATSASSTPIFCDKALYASIIYVDISSGIGAFLIIFLISSAAAWSSLVSLISILLKISITFWNIPVASMNF